MPALNPLPPQFLLPSWNARQLLQLRWIHNHPKKSPRSARQIGFDHTKWGPKHESATKARREVQVRESEDTEETPATGESISVEDVNETKALKNVRDEKLLEDNAPVQQVSTTTELLSNHQMPRGSARFEPAARRAQQGGRPDKRKALQGRLEDGDFNIRRAREARDETQELGRLLKRDSAAAESKKADRERLAGLTANVTLGPSKWTIPQSSKRTTTVKENITALGPEVSDSTPEAVLGGIQGNEGESLSVEENKLRGRSFRRLTLHWKAQHLDHKVPVGFFNSTQASDVNNLKNEDRREFEEDTKKVQTVAEGNDKSSTHGYERSGQFLQNVTVTNKMPKAKTKKEKLNSIPNSHPKSAASPSSGSPPNSKSIKKVSLLEELFPEEARKLGIESATASDNHADLPPLPPPDLDELGEDPEVLRTQGQLQSKLVTRDAAMHAFRQENTTVLVLSRASTAMTDDDFRRIAPRGTHIEEWRGPGDIMKVIPGRDPKTLEPQGYYFLLFPNPAFARAYQNEVIRLHLLAGTHTPTSLESPITAPSPGIPIKGEDIYTLLQDYALWPPSQRVSLRIVTPPHSRAVQSMIENLGYSAIVLPENKTSRAVLFWVNGYQPTTYAVKTMLAKDGQDRGLQWGPLDGKGSIAAIDEPPQQEETEDEPLGEGETKVKKHSLQRWVIAFEDENEARRFIRTWHRMPYPFPLAAESFTYDEPPPLVHAEFLW